MAGVDVGTLDKELTLVGQGRKVDIIGAICEPPQMELTIDGASTLTVKISDHERTFLTSPKANERCWAVIKVDGTPIHFELVQISKGGDYVSLTFEDAIAAALRKKTAPHSFQAGHWTRRDIGVWFANEAKVPYLIDPGHPEKVQTPIIRSEKKSQTTTSWDVTGSDVAEPIKWRRFSDGTHLVLGGDDWLTTLYKKPVTIRENTDGVQSIDFDLDVAKRASTATVSIDARLRAFLPGAPVQIAGTGPGDNLWITSDFDRPVTSTRATLTLTRKTHVLAEPKKQSNDTGPSDKDSGDPNYIPGQTAVDTGGKAANAARQKMVDFALAQSGKPYVWGASGPGSYDCSGLVQAATAAAGKTLAKPSSSQWSTCVREGKTISVQQALGIRGALLFIQTSDEHHVAISLGNGTTVQAKGTAYGCGVFGNAANGGWTGAALWV